MSRVVWALLGALTAVAIGAGCDAICASRSQLAAGSYAPSSAMVGVDGYSLVVDGDLATVHERFSVDGHAHERSWRVTVLHHYDRSN